MLIANGCMMRSAFCSFSAATLGLPLQPFGAADDPGRGFRPLEYLGQVYCRLMVGRCLQYLQLSPSRPAPAFGALLAQPFHLQATELDARDVESEREHASLDVSCAQQNRG